MFIDFLKSLHPILQEEEKDFKEVIELLSYKSSVNFMPSVTFDLWPVFSIQCTDAKQELFLHNENVYIVSIGEADFFFKHELENLVTDFYNKDKFEPNHMYGGELEEMILLSAPFCEEKISVESIHNSVNVVYMSIAMPDGSTAHLFFVTSTAAWSWVNIFEKHEVSCCVLIDSHKGMGDWLTTTELWRKLTATKLKDLLPKFYFKGKFISNNAPEGFEFISSIKESDSSECISKIYRARFRK